MRFGVLLLLAAAWLSWSGHYTVGEWLIALFGLASCLFVWRLYLALERAAGGGGEYFPPSALPRLPRFLLHFTYRVAISNIHVARLILVPGQLSISRLPGPLLRVVYTWASSSEYLFRLLVQTRQVLMPRLRRVRASQQTAFGQTLYANYITLTPGTITLDLRDGELLVYALDAECEEDVIGGVLDRAVTRLEGTRT